MIAMVLRRDCEAEIARWAEGVSLSQEAESGRLNEIAEPIFEGHFPKLLISSTRQKRSDIASVWIFVEGDQAAFVRLRLGDERSFNIDLSAEEAGDLA
ncbi:MAG: hypothetical protein M3Q08_02475 [Pseudomonadota bacterium]|nr:hypothetical protein [Pseudomonadota bacterium]